MPISQDFNDLLLSISAQSKANDILVSDEDLGIKTQGPGLLSNIATGDTKFQQAATRGLEKGIKSFKSGVEQVETGEGIVEKGKGALTAGLGGLQAIAGPAVEAVGETILGPLIQKASEAGQTGLKAIFENITGPLLKATGIEDRIKAGEIPLDQALKDLEDFTNKTSKFIEESPLLKAGLQAGETALGVFGAEQVGKQILRQAPKITKLGDEIIKSVTIGAKKAGEGLKQVGSKIGDISPFREVKTVKEAQGKAFKALNPTINKLSKNRNIGGLRAKADRANEIIVEKGFKPQSTEQRVEVHQEAMKGTWKQIENTLKSKGKDVNIDFKQVGNSIDDYLKRNPALEANAPNDFKTLKDLSEVYKEQGLKDVLYAENAKQIINGQIKNWGGGDQLSEAVNNGLKKATANIGKQLDETLSKIPGELSNLKKDYGSLAETLEDAVKANVVNMRKKGFGLTESYSRIEGFSDIAEGLFSLIGSPKDVLPKLIKGGAKLAIGKQLSKLRDPDILVKDAFNILFKEINKVSKPQVPQKLLTAPLADFQQSAK